MPVSNPAYSQGECHLIREVLARLGDRWSLSVMAALADGRKRFGEVRRSQGLENISQRMLTLTLRTLERDGLVSRTKLTDARRSVEYGLTELGTKFIAPIKTIVEWARTHGDDMEKARSQFDDWQAGSRAESAPDQAKPASPRRQSSRRAG
ncbi:helix-turn-helix domain-containing protein [Xanthomonas arboricola]|uniref:winged helix-turn-helix transcriptional regulator n=1 Tax=Xanthomonas arboricola TaxID=56448 RepID=UPI002DD6AC31|nr:helix-turn-helix domain-containing protein [Xanthomonas arboricola]